jgi:hypothetical protein
MLAKRLIPAATLMATVVTPALAGSGGERHIHTQLRPPERFLDSGLSPTLGGNRHGIARVAITLNDDPLGEAARAPGVRERLDGRLTLAEASRVRRGGRAAATRVLTTHAAGQLAAAARLRPAVSKTARLLDRVDRAVRLAGGHVVAVHYAGPTLIAYVPRGALASIASRGDVGSIETAPVERPMGALANETAAVGTSTWWSNGHTGGSGNADVVPANLAIMDDKIQQDQPLLNGIAFENPQNSSTGTYCGQATAGCEHGTEVAGMAVAVGSSKCGPLCTADSETEQGIAYGVAHVLDADTSAMPDSNTCLFDGAIWAFGITQAPIGDCEHSLPGTSYPAVVHSDSHGSYTTMDDGYQAKNLDKFASTYGDIQTEPSGNDGANGSGSGHITSTCDAYDVICAGGISVNDPTTTSDDAIADFSSRGPSPQGRKKPDIVAIAAGTNNGNMTVLEQRYIANNRLERGDTGTSFASPQVAGAAALLYGAGLTDPLIVKAVLLDSTTLGRVDAGSPMGTQISWQPDWGWGELNLDSAYQQRKNFVADAVGAQQVRFYRASVNAGDRVTLVWNRRVVGPLVQTIPPQAMTLSNLDLYEYDTTQTQQTSSTSTIDNVEQVRGAQDGSMVYKVKDQSSTVDGATAEPFALAAKNPLTPLVAPKPTVTLTLDRDHTRQAENVTVTETVSNPSSDIAGSNATASLGLPAGVTATSGGSTTWSPGAGTLGTGATASHQWTVTGIEDGLKQLSATVQDGAFGETFTTSTIAILDVDSIPPVPSLSCPVSGGTNPNLALSWNAADASPIAGYDLEVSTDGGPYGPWLTSVTQTSATWTGQAGHAYAFRVRAADDLGNSSDYVACGPASIGFAPIPPATPLPAPTKLLPAPAHLKLSTVAIRGRRLIIRGGLADHATGTVTCTYTARRRRPVRARSRVRGGSYRLSIPLPGHGAARPGLLSVQYSGDRTFAPQRISRRVSHRSNAARNAIAWH